MPMTIRSTQMDGLADNIFVGQLERMLVQVLPDARQVASEELRGALSLLVPAARRYGLVTPSEIGRFVYVAYLLGTDFDHRFAAASDILTDFKRPPDERLTLLEAWASQLLAVLEG